MITVTVIPDGHYFRTPDGNIFSNGIYTYNFFERYLRIFDKVYVIGRITKVKARPRNSKLASGLNVEFLELPPYKGPIQYLKKYFSIKNKIKKYIYNSDCIILRAPSAMFSIAIDILQKKDIPWAMEVVVDPWEYFSPGTIDSPIRPLYRYIWTRNLIKACRQCEIVSYVTKYYLQEKYPCKALLEPKKDYFYNFYSSVEIKDGSIASVRNYEKKASAFHLIHVAANIEGYGKGHIIVLKILKILLDNNYKVDVTFIGDGNKLSEFKNYAFKLGIADKVNFLGRLPGVEEVRSELKKADLFIFPTKAEGLPRVLIEAMAEGLPCLSTPVCGIPEILDSNWMYDFDNVYGFAQRIMYCIDNPKELSNASSKNICVAVEYEHSNLCKKRDTMFKKLKNKVVKGGN